MIHALMLLAVPAAVCAANPVATAGARDASPSLVAAAPYLPTDSLRTVYQEAQTWEAFYAGANARRELWVSTWTNARIPEAFAARARAAGGPWRILVITISGCSDSANSVPYIAKLAQETPGLELRLTNPTAGRPWMEAHRAPDGRAATPTVLLLDDEFRIRGCWVEQPAELQAFWLPVMASGTAARPLPEKLAWYAGDKGQEILREIVEMLEGAQLGAVVCPGLK